jgi:hypothetical protein
MTVNENLLAAVIAKISAGKPDIAFELNVAFDTLPDDKRAELASMILKHDPHKNLAALFTPGETPFIDLLPADTILTTNWPEPIWAVPGLLPVGLTILAGAPKVGKSWLALQIAQAVAVGGFVFGTLVERGPVLYLALEDPPRRLKERMNKQKWPMGLDADFMTVGSFIEKIGDLRNGGGERLTRQIEQRGYRFVAIDTLSRTIAGDQNDVQQMTSWLTPLQVMAHEQNCAVVLIDHHRKTGSIDPDAIGDILGSTAKGAMTDTALGLYRERGKAGARLLVTGREVEEKTLNLRMDWLTGCWQLEAGNEGMTTQQTDLLDVLEQIGPAGVNDIAEAVGRNRGNVYKQLTELERKGKVVKVGKEWGKV